ncbi:hypothetical protein N7486_000617 [Penicillium sp. IBT 16267x]|nr:hypothetical protein N7486_000617 [Penicillium sp. IBT 16267x]
MDVVPPLLMHDDLLYPLVEQQNRTLMYTDIPRDSFGISESASSNSILACETAAACSAVKCYKLKALTETTDITWDPNGSNEQIASGDKEVVTTTDIETRFEDVEGQHARSSTESHSGDDLTRKQSPDSRNVV